ncbi:hypothetical protein AsAng_0023690 [Aureispira anguillae]|uniref:Uncharacterized protein n=1 Tax=Aureispira anguillae TaxID=2864201 RepID=A0A915YEN9_9BACT|nr:hypothetical protein AsAng_0023690 [Aureispira anguillae]
MIYCLLNINNFIQKIENQIVIKFPLINYLFFNQPFLGIRDTLNEEFLFGIIQYTTLFFIIKFPKIDN